MLPAVGRVESVREFAAAHAASEERHRSSIKIGEALRLDGLKEAQRRMAEMARCVRLHSLPASGLLAEAREALSERSLSRYLGACREKVRSVLTQAKVKDEAVIDAAETVPNRPAPRQPPVDDDVDAGTASDMAAEVLALARSSPLMHACGVLSTPTAAAHTRGPPRAASPSRLCRRFGSFVALGCPTP